MILAADWVVPVEGAPVRDGAVRVERGRVVEVAPGLEADRRFPGAVILPGLVNAHTHLEYQAMGGFGDGLPFGRWLEDHIRRRRDLVPDDYAAQAAAGARACLAAGVTTIADCSWAGASVAAAAAAGLRAVVYLEAFSSRPRVVAATAERLDELEAGATGLVELGVSPHAPYTVSHDDFRALVGLARARGLRSATHLLESERETDHVEAFADVLGPDTLAIHAVALTARDVALLAELRAPVAHCPRSNSLLGCGVAPVRALLDAGVHVGLGTDSPASALDFDLWQEMRAAIMLARGSARDPGALGAAEALRLATADGAAALGLEAGTGTLAPGAPADLVVLDLSDSPFAPLDDPVTAAVYAGSPERVLLTMVGGRVRYRRSARARGADGGAAVSAVRTVRAKMIGA